MTPQPRNSPSNSSTPPDRVPLEQRAAQAGTPAHLVAALRVHANWAPGREVTEREYEDALSDLNGTPVLTTARPAPIAPTKEVTTDG